MLEALARPALARWRSEARRAFLKREEALFAKALFFFASTAARAAFSRWAAFVPASREARALFRRAAGAFASRASSAAFARWVQRVDDRKARRALFRRAMSWWKARSKTAAWLRWRDAVVDAKTARWAARFFVDRARSAAFARWAEFAYEARDARRVATRAARHWTLRRAAAWRRGRRAAAMAATASVDARGGALQVARARRRVREWDQTVSETRAARELLRRAVTRFESQRCGAFGRWLDVAEEARAAPRYARSRVGSGTTGTSPARLPGGPSSRTRRAAAGTRRAAPRAFASRTRAAAMATWRAFGRSASAGAGRAIRADAHFAARARARGLSRSCTT